MSELADVVLESKSLLLVGARADSALLEVARILDELDRDLLYVDFGGTRLEACEVLGVAPRALGLDASVELEWGREYALLELSEILRRTLGIGLRDAMNTALYLGSAIWGWETGVNATLELEGLGRLLHACFGARRGLDKRTVLTLAPLPYQARRICLHLLMACAASGQLERYALLLPSSTAFQLLSSRSNEYALDLVERAGTWCTLAISAPFAEPGRMPLAWLFDCVAVVEKEVRVIERERPGVEAASWRRIPRRLERVATRALVARGSPREYLGRDGELKTAPIERGMGSLELLRGGGDDGGE